MNSQKCTTLLQSDLSQVLRGRTRGWLSVLLSLFSKHSSREIWARPLCKSTGACQDQITGLLSPSASRCLCRFLIVFRPQCEESRQEHVGVVWREGHVACLFTAQQLKITFYLRTISDTNYETKHRMLLYHILWWYSCQLCHTSICWKGREPIAFQFTVSSTKHNRPQRTLTSLNLEPTWIQHFWMNESMFIIMCLWGSYECVGKHQ